MSPAWGWVLLAALIAFGPDWLFWSVGWAVAIACLLIAMAVA